MFFFQLTADEAKKEKVAESIKTDQTPRCVLNELASSVRQEHGDDLLPYLGKYFTNSKQISRARQENLKIKMPPPPKSFEDMEEENLDQMFTKTTPGNFGIIS